MQKDKSSQDAATSEGRSPKRVAAAPSAAPESSPCAKQEPLAAPPARWSAGAKTDAVLRLFAGESIEEVSRQCRVSAADLVKWRDDFLEGGKAALKSRPVDLTEERLKQAQAKIGDLALRLEVAETYFKKKGVSPWKK